jgi:hypothetical protein
LHHSALAQEGAVATIDVQLLNMQDGVAAVEVVTASAGSPRSYRQTHFYQQTPSGWLRATPVAALWGSPQRRETEHFILHYRRQDAAAVAEVAAQIDGLYRTMHEGIGLAAPAAHDKVMIEIDVEQPPGHYSPGAVVQDTFRIASPALYLAPVELTDAELVSQAIALILLEQTLIEAVQLHDIPRHWQPLLNGVRLWTLWEMELPLSVWRDEVVTWLYTRGPTATDRTSSILPEQYAELCAMHRQWMLSPRHLQIPLRCNDLDRREWLPVWHYVTDPPRQLSELTIPWRQSIKRGTFRPQHPSAVVAQATLIEYGVSTYGDEFVPILIAGLAHHAEWETLLPALFDVSAAQFEAGWHEYMASRYRVQVGS